MRFGDPEPLDRRHVLEGFDCGTPSLSNWLLRHARGAAGVRSARTYVLSDHEQDRVVGYHALTAASISHPDATQRARKGMPRHRIPSVLLARLAVDRSVQGRGLGAFLLADAMKRSTAAAEVIGARLLLVHALDERAASFYRRFGFAASPTDSRNLEILIGDIPVDSGG